jgi:hypothetical protein
MKIIGLIIVAVGLLLFFVGFSEKSSVANLKKKHPIYTRLFYRRQLADQESMGDKKMISSILLLLLGLLFMTIF